MKILHLIFLILIASASSSFARDYDVVIYGGTSAAITAAIQAKQMGKSVIVVSPDMHLGGLTAGGLGFTDSGDKSVIGGLSRAFYHRVWQHYQDPDSWTWQKRSEFKNRGQGHSAIDDVSQTMWVFEPSVAERIFEDWVAEHDIEIVRDEWLYRENGVKRDGDRITAITTLSGAIYRGRMFIDATYEGDLMAAAGVDYRVGREANSEYGEEHNGVQTGVLHHNHHFGPRVLAEPIDPYVIPGDPSSGVLPRISTEPTGEFGSADHRVQAYCFRTCYTNDPNNRVPWPKPDGYDASQYELLLRVFDAGWRGFFGKFDGLPNDKTDTNNHGPFSYDNIGYNYDYPEADYDRRNEIIAEHRTYQQGLIWFAANDPRVPKEVQDEFNTWGLARDEFVDNGNWPHQLYIREARRMVGLHVMTENQLLGREPTPDPIGMGSYTIDSHNVQRYVSPDGYVQNEGDIGVHLKEPYTIAYGSLVPQRGQAANLLVPVACSASHIAYGSIRMEPVFMILGQSAATAAVLALDAELDVQDVPYADLSERLIADGQMITASTTGQNAVLETPGLVAFWNFSEPAGTPRQSLAGHGELPLQEVGGSIPRVAGGPFGGYAADLDGAHYFRIPYSDTGALNISGPDAEVSMFAVVRVHNLRQSRTIAGMWSEGKGANDDTGTRQYALLMNMPTYGGGDKLTPHVSSEGGVSRRADGSAFPWCVDYAATTEDVPTDTWCSLAFTYDGRYLKAYINGSFEERPLNPTTDRRDDPYFTQEGPQGGDRGMNPYYHGRGIFSYDEVKHANDKRGGGADFTVGARYAVGSMLREASIGQFGGLAVFDRALTDAEIASLHAAAEVESLNH